MIKLVGRTYEERAEAGAILIGLVDRHRHARGPVELGHFSGFRLEFRPMVADRVSLLGVMSYDANVSASPAGIIASVEHAVRSIEERIGRTQENLAQTRKSLVDFAALADRPFEHESRYREVVTRQAELVQALDITKNQKAEGLSADAPATNVETTTPMESPEIAPAEVERISPARASTKLRIAI